MQENQSAAQKKAYPSRDCSGNDPAEHPRGTHDTFFNLVKNAPFGIYVVDSGFRLIQISAGAKKVFSHVDPLIGRDFAEVLRCLWQEPFATEFIGRFRHTLATGEAYHSADTTGLRNDVDDEESYDWKIERITLPDGSYGVVCYFYDLTERQQFEAKLLESEQRMSLVLRSANVGIMTLDLKDKTIYRSPEYYAAFGATEADNTYDGLTRFVHPDDLPEIQRHFDEAVRTAAPYQAEFRIIRDDGVIRWLGNLGNTEYDEDGAPARFFNTIFDITERKQRELNQAFVGEMDRVLSGIMDTDQIIGTACEKIGKYLGVANCTLAEVDTDVNTAIVDQVWCRDEDAVDFSGSYDLVGFVSESYRQALIAGRSVIVEDVTNNEITAGFSDRFLQLKIGSFVNTPFLSDGRLKYLLNIFDTVPRTWLPWEAELLESLIPRIRLRIERGRAQQKLRESEERLSLIVESVSDYAIITIDDHGAVTGWNAAAQSIYGYSPDEMIGANFATLFQEDDIKNNVPQAELELPRTAGRAPDDRWMLKKDGSKFYASGFTSKFESRGEAGFVKIIQDLTLKIETEKLHRQQELLENIVKSQEAERHRIARDLHDHLGQRITALRFAINALRTDENELAGNGEHIEKIERLALQIDRDASMLAFELRPSVLEDVRLEEALRSYVAEWSSNTGVAAEVHGSTSHENRFEAAIETNLFRIAQEALNNVAKHAQASRVNVMVEKRQDRIILILEDDGVGYDAEKLVEPNARTGGGFGMVGMRERAAILGGVLEIESSPNGGTTIYVTVPAK